MQTRNRKGVWAMRAAAAVAMAFGAATAMSGASVLFGGGAAAAGNIIVPLVWFNFVAGFVYMVAGVGLWCLRPWALPVSILLAAANLLAFGALAAMIAAGSAYEDRTVAAMILRTTMWAVFALLAWRLMRHPAAQDISGT